MFNSLLVLFRNNVPPPEIVLLTMVAAAAGSRVPTAMVERPLVGFAAPGMLPRAPKPLPPVPATVNVAPGSISMLWMPLVWPSHRYCTVVLAVISLLIAPTPEAFVEPGSQNWARELAAGGPLGDQFPDVSQNGLVPLAPD